MEAAEGLDPLGCPQSAWRQNLPAQQPHAPRTRRPASPPAVPARSPSFSLSELLTPHSAVASAALEAGVYTIKQVDAIKCMGADQKQQAILGRRLLSQDATRGARRPGAGQTTPALWQHCRLPNRQGVRRQDHAGYTLLKARRGGPPKPEPLLLAPVPPVGSQQ